MNRVTCCLIIQSSGILTMLLIVNCYGLTKDLSNGNYMLVMNKMSMDLRNYLQQNHNQLTWKERIQITVNIIGAIE